MYDSILVPTDGSEGSEVAIERAIDAAETYDAALHTLYVVETPGGAEGVEAGSVLQRLREHGDRAIRTVISMADDADIGTVEGSVAEGVPHTAILQYTDQHDIDLIVMGTHGRTGLGRYMLGSVTEKVVRLSDVPVLTVPLRQEEEGEEENSE
ncbi:MAG: universal stress protein [Haloarculaceae archaeon]